MPAAKLCFCPGSHHTICQCSARHLLLGSMPSPQDSSWYQSCERCNYGAITISFSGSWIPLSFQNQWGQWLFQVTYCSGMVPILYWLAGILSLLLFISFLFIPTTSPLKAQKQFRRNKHYVCSAWKIWNVFAKLSDEISNLHRVNSHSHQWTDIFPSSWMGFAND